MDALDDNAFERIADLVGHVIMTVFPAVTVYYVSQRRAHGSLDKSWQLGYAIRRWINVGLVIAWVKVSVQKSYLFLRVSRVSATVP